MALHLSISDGFDKTKMFNKQDDFDLNIMNFPFLDGDVPHSTFHGIYISQRIRFARVSSHVDDLTSFDSKTSQISVMDIINFVRCFLNFIGGILPWCLNIMSD